MLAMSAALGGKVPALSGLMAGVAGGVAASAAGGAEERGGIGNSYPAPGSSSIGRVLSSARLGPRYLQVPLWHRLEQHSSSNVHASPLSKQVSQSGSLPESQSGPQQPSDSPQAAHTLSQ